MKKSKLAAIALTLVIVGATAVQAAHYLRQYYGSSWSYSPSYSYYYVNYYYEPVVYQSSYNYHYCIYYPSQPSYIYYYNPVSQAYWGRYKVGSKGDQRYSILAQKDRKKDLKDIPEEAFPAPAKMPTIPGAEDGVAMEPPPDTNLPKAAPK